MVERRTYLLHVNITVQTGNAAHVPDKGKIFSKGIFSFVILTTFEFSAKKYAPNYLKMAGFKAFQMKNDGFSTILNGQISVLAQIDKLKCQF